MISLNMAHRFFFGIRITSTLSTAPWDIDASSVPGLQLSKIRSTYGQNDNR
jgi:hypothetical protein